MYICALRMYWMCCVYPVCVSSVARCMALKYVCLLDCFYTYADVLNRFSERTSLLKHIFSLHERVFFLPLQQTTNTYGWDVVFSLFSRSSSFCSRASFYLKHRNVVHTVCVMPYSILFVAHTHNSICHVSKIDGLENIIDIMQKSEANVKNKIDHNNIIFEMYCVSIWQMRRGVCSNMRIFIGEIKAKHQKQQHTAKRE